MEQGRREMKPPPQQPPTENQPPNHPPPPPRNCPRCDSGNTKFCYYNNYSLSQPRYFCKGCRRYWTQGGTLRNVPVGGGCRKAKRAKTSSSSNGENISIPTPPPVGAAPNYYPGGGFLSSLAAMNSFSQPHSPFGSSSSGFSLFQGFTLPSLSSQLPPQTTEFYQMTNQSLDQPNRPLGFWNQTLIDNNNNSGSNPNPNPIVGAPLNPNPFPDFPGYDPSSS